MKWSPSSVEKWCQKYEKLAHSEEIKNWCRTFPEKYKDFSEDDKRREIFCVPIILYISANTKIDIVEHSSVGEIYDKAFREIAHRKHGIKQESMDAFDEEKEEIKEEALVRDIVSFERFLEVAAICDGEILNYENIATDCGVSAKTVAAYFQILYDTLVGYEIPAYTKHIKRKLVQAPRFYYFDVGIVNYLLGRTNLKRGTDEFGHAFEHLVIQEIIAYLGYTESTEKLSYWRTYTGIEVDAIIGDARIAIEIKSTDEIQTKHKKNLKVFAEEHPGARKIIVSLDKMTRETNEIEMIYVLDFFKMLWNGQII